MRSTSASHDRAGGLRPEFSPDWVRLACHAMRCRFELALSGGETAYLRAAGEEAIEEITALDRQLNFFSAASEICAINRSAPDRPVRVEPRLFDLLLRCRELWEMTGGCFDPTVGPLMECWGFGAGEAKPPSAEALAEAMARTGMDQVVLDKESRTARFARPGVSLNLGGIGKGYAIDRALEILRGHGVGFALIHAGTSTVGTIGRMPDGRPCRIGIASPLSEEATLAEVEIEDQCLSVSGNHRKTREAGGYEAGHVMDPRSGRPVTGALMAAVVTATATEADALSTALLCAGRCDSEWERSVAASLVVTIQNERPRPEARAGGSSRTARFVVLESRE